MKVHDWIGHVQGDLTYDYGAFLAAYPSYSGIVKGKCICSIGVVPSGKDKYVAWGLLTPESGKHMLFISREIKKFLCLFEARRIEAHVRADFIQGNKLMKILGFQCETPTPMKKWGDNGLDYFQYAKV